MIQLDMRTVVFLAAISYLVCTVFVIQLWRQSRGRFDGMNLLAINFVFQTVGLYLILSRGAIPDWVSIALANILMLAGALLSFIGLERFLQKPGPQLHNYFLLAAASVALGVFSVVDPDLPKRTLVVSVVFLIICGQCVWLLWRRVEPVLRPLTFGAGMIFAGYCLLSIVRIVGYFVGAPGPTDYFQSGAFQALVLIAYQTLLILLTYSLVLMVNRRLVTEIATQQDKFAKAFQSAPYAIILTRLSDGAIIDVNDQFVAVTGYERAEIIGKSPIDLRVWEREEDRVAVKETLARDGTVTARELNFRTKSGASVTGIFSAEIIPADGGSIVLSCILDISERKQGDYLFRESEKKYRILIDNLSAGVVVHNADTSVLLANGAAASILGLSEEQILGKTAMDPYWCFLHENGAPMPLKDYPVNQAIASPTGVHNWVIGVKRPDRAEPLWLICNAAPIRDEKDDIVQVVVTFIDITERKEAEALNRESELRREREHAAALEAQRLAGLAALNLMEDAVAARNRAEAALADLARLSRIYATYSQSNQAIIRCNSEDALFPQICRDAVNLAGFKMAWIGEVDMGAGLVKPVAVFGDDAGYLTDIVITMNPDDPHGQGPTAVAIRENRPFWCQDFLHDLHTAPWQEAGARAGWAASGALPLCRNGVVVGVLTLYAGEPDFFDDEIKTLLVNMAADISFAMDSYASVAERSRAESRMVGQLEELQRWQQVTLGREGRILTMKQEANSLLAELGQPPRYTSAADAEAEKRALP